MNPSHHAPKTGEYRVLDLFSPNDPADVAAASADPAASAQVKLTNPEADSFVFVNPLFARPGIPRHDLKG